MNIGVIKGQKYLNRTLQDQNDNFNFLKKYYISSQVYNVWRSGFMVTQRGREILSLFSVALGSSFLATN
jgi:hypothetical protein